MANHKLSPLEHVAARLRRGPKAPGDETIQEWLESSRMIAKRWERHEAFWIQSESISSELSGASKAMLNALENIKKVEEDFNIIIGLPLGDLESLGEFKAGLEKISSRFQTTEWFKNRHGKGRSRLPVAAIVLHVHAAEMLHACGQLATTGAKGEIAWMGRLLCEAFGITFSSKGGVSTLSARLAKDVVRPSERVAWAFLEYGLLPDWPLDTPLFLMP